MLFGLTSQLSHGGTQKVAQQLINRLLRFTVRLPGYSALVRRVWGRPSEISLGEARFLGDLVRKASAGRPIIEIGTLFGGSTRVITLFKSQTTPLFTVDSFRWNPLGLRPAKHAEITRAVLADAIAKHNVMLYEMDKRRFYAEYREGPPGLVFLDANHGYASTLEDIRWAQSVGSQIICGHDHSAKFPGVIRAVKECGGAESVVESVFVLRRVSSTV